ncbi:unnamed protein product [Rotaria sp. Silwood2]|nr:unnamed protein product [Rotaria sp. Silwood2]CAF4338073.1 unnamed protein product [Rotaria sp. Silwood2]
MTSLPNLLSKYVVFSYNKKNEELVLNIYNYLKNENLPVWIYVQDIINKDIYESERIPIIACRLLPNWKPSGWLNKVTSDQLTIDLHGINQRNFKDKMNKLREKIISVLENKNDLKNLSWSSYSNNLIILMKKEIYLLNPLTCCISTIESIKLKDHREEFLSCSCSKDKIFIIKCQFNSNTYYLEEYYLSTFRFIRKFQILDLIEIGTSLIIQNRFYNQFYYLSNSFIKMFIDIEFNLKINQYNNYSNGFMDFNGNIRNVALLGTSNLVFLIDNAFIIYQL